MIARVLVLLFAIVLIAAGTERMCADVCVDRAADIVDDDAVVHVTELPCVPVHPEIVAAPAPRDGIAPAPELTRVFRPPRAVRV